jgi:hypothetical protein
MGPYSFAPFMECNHGASFAWVQKAFLSRMVAVI